MYFGGDITVNRDSSTIYSNNNEVFLKCIPGNNHYGIYSGDFSFAVNNRTLSDNLLGNHLLKLAGLTVFFDEITVNNDGVELSGQIEFPEIMGSILLDISAIYLTEDGVDFGGSLYVDKIDIFNTFSIEDFFITFDSQEDNFSFDGTLKFYQYGITAHTEIIQGKLNSIGIIIDGPKIPIPGTGFAFAKYGGGVDGLAYPPLILHLNTDIVTYPTGDFSLVSLDGLTLDYTWGTSIFEGGGRIKIFTAPIASASILISRDYFSFDGNITITPGFEWFIGDFEADVYKFNDNIKFNGRLYARLQIPKINYFPGGWLPLPITIAETDNYINNESIYGSFRINLLLISAEGHYILTWVDNEFNSYFAKGWKDWDDKLFNNKNLVFNPELKNNYPIEGISYFVTQENVDNQLKLNEGKYILEFDLNEYTNFMVIRLHNDQLAPTYNLILPDSTIITPENVNSFEYFAYHINNELNNSYYLINCPPLGHWTLEIDDNTDTYVLDVFASQISPIIQLNDPIIDESSVIISWSDDDKDDNAIINLYYDSDNHGANGYPIVLDISEDEYIDQYNWEIDENIQSGLYYIYGIIQDTNSTPYISYASSPVKIINKNAPNKPSNLTGSAQNDSLISLSWNYGQSDPSIRFNVYYSKDISDLNYTSSYFNIGTVREYSFNNFVPGSTYHFCVTAVDTNFNESDYSNIISIDFQSTINNSPTIADQIIPGNTYVSAVYSYNLQCNDPDGDNLEYQIQCLFGSDTLEDKITIDNNGLLYWEPEFEDIGHYLIKIKVTDPYELSDSISFNLNVFDPTIDNKSIYINSPIYTCFGGRCYISVIDRTLIKSPKEIDSINLKVFSNADSNGISLTAIETEPNSKQYLAIAEFSYLSSNNYQVKVDSSDILTALYVNEYFGDSIKDFCYFEYEPFEVSIQKEGDTIFCTGDTLNITLNAYSDDYTSYLWSDGETRTSTFTVSEPGMYWVTVSNRRGCIQTSDTVLIGPSPSPEPIILGPDTSRVCDSTILDPGEFPQCTFQWDNGDTTQTTIVTDTGWQKLTVTNQFGCIGVDSVYINKVDQDPVADFYYIVMHPNDFQFRDTSQFPGTYYWDFGDDTIASTSTLQNPSHQYLKDGRYNCMLIITNSCSSDTMIMPIDANYVEDLQLPEIAIHPNPTTGIVSISIAGKIRIGEVRISIIDIVGNKLMEQKDACNTEYSNDFDLSKFSKGVYILNIRSKDWQIIKKIIRK